MLMLNRITDDWDKGGRFIEPWLEGWVGEKTSGLGNVHEGYLIMLWSIGSRLESYFKAEG